ncbi:MAG: ABC transporter substrate-binding protein [Peptococcaceae bacterium]|nr:ABC transporter substrate-binding protein [Peptococcaceae bacterium]
MKKALGLFLVLLMFFSLAACGGGANTGTANTADTATTAPAGGNGPTEATAEEGPKYGGRVRWVGVGDTAEAIGLPQYLPAANTTLLPPWAECLLLEETDGTIQPFLAESWEIQDAENQVLFKLREGVYFTDGSEFNAEVAKWNIDLMIETKIMNPAVIGCDVLGDYEIAVLLNGFTNAVLPIFASHSFCFVSKENFDKLGVDEAKNNPVGTGPFIMKEQVPGQRIIWERNDNYWQEGKPYLDEIEFVQMTDTMTQNASVLSTNDGDRVDVLNTFLGEQIQLLGNTAPVTVTKIPSGQISLYPSSREASSPLNKLEVRQAISYAIDRESITDARGFGVLTPALAFVPAPYIGNFGDRNFFEYDPDKARELLAAAGYADGFNITLYNTPNVDTDAMVAIQSMLGEVGITVSIESPEAGAATELRVNGWEGLFSGPFTTLASMSSTFRLQVDPDYQFYPSMWRPDEEMREPYEAARKTLKCEQDMFEPLHQMLIDNMVLIPIYTQYNSFIINNRVHDSGWGEWGVGTMFKPWDVWVD